MLVLEGRSTSAMGSRRSSSHHHYSKPNSQYSQATCVNVTSIAVRQYNQAVRQHVVFMLLSKVTLFIVIVGQYNQALRQHVVFIYYQFYHVIVDFWRSNVDFYAL